MSPRTPGGAGGGGSGVGLGLPPPVAVTALELAALTAEVVAAHDDDVTAKCLIVADVGYATPDATLLVYKTWWRVSGVQRGVVQACLVGAHTLLS
jgi:hypothetical protein